MKITEIRTDTGTIARVESDEVLISDVPSALDLMATIRYEADTDRMILPKAAIDERFFVLSSGLAGEILQKFVNYQVKLAIVGDYSRYTSKPLRDFIYESNQGNHVFFVSSEADAVAKLSQGRE